MNTLFERELAKRLAKLRADRVEATVQTVLSQLDYSKNIGYIQCIDHVLAICDDIRGGSNDGDQGS